MADQSQFGAPGKGAGKAKGPAGRRLSCAECEALLPDVMDGTVTAEQSNAFDEHTGSCRECGKMVAEAQRGKAWLELLKQEEPEPPAGLVSKILAQTSGQGFGQGFALASGLQHADAGGRRDQAARQALAGIAGGPVTAATGAGTVAVGSGAGLGVRKPVEPAWKRVNLVAAAQTMRRTVFEPRMALTAAMAFFSISLTLNLAGIHLSDVKAADLKPQNLKRTISRGYSDTTGRVERYYYNLRFVYEMESRVRELRRAAETSPATAPSSNQDKQEKSKPEEKKNPDGTSGGTTSDWQKQKLNNRLASDEIHKPDGKQAEPKKKTAPAVPAGEILEATVLHQRSQLEPEVLTGQLIPAGYEENSIRSNNWSTRIPCNKSCTSLEKESARATSERRPA